ncbi:MAG: type II CAAX prenyl endopeptidase Rce1 family protein [Spirochaetia bacterium]
MDDKPGKTKAVFSSAVFFLISLLLYGLLELLRTSIPAVQNIPLVSFAPGSAAVIMILFYKSRPAGAEVFSIPKAPVLIIAAFITPLIIGVISFLTVEALEFRASIVQAPGYSLFSFVITFSLLSIGAVFEEFGWRGYLYPLLKKQMGMLKAAILTGFFWALWHIAYYSLGTLFMINFVVFSISASIIIAVIMEKTGQSLLTPILFHISINLGFLIFFSQNFHFYYIMFTQALIWLAAALLFVSAIHIRR